MKAAWCAKTAKIDSGRQVFLDESGAKMNLTRLYGRALDGERVVDATPQGQWCTTAMLSSIRLDGTTAALVIEGPTDAEVFGAYVEGVLVPSLRPGDIVVMDKLAPHKMPAVAQRIRAAGGEVWFLPPYSPDLNPIEKMWSKVREFLRSAKARTWDALWQAIAAALRTVSQTDAINWFKACGYRCE